MAHAGQPSNFGLWCRMFGRLEVTGMYETQTHLGHGEALVFLAFKRTLCCNGAKLTFVYRNILPSGLKVFL
jgi:hypothetical protein